MTVKNDSELLELPKILARLAGYAAMEETKEKALALNPSNDIAETELNLCRTERAADIINASGSPRFACTLDIIPLVKRAGLGGILNPKELLIIADTLRTVREVKYFFGTAAVEPGVLSPFAERLTPNKYLEEKIYSAIKNENELNDAASVKLQNIRQKIAAASFHMKERLQTVIHGSDTAKYLRETVITQRSGRYVVPVKAEYRGKIHGFVHDASASGATLFIEPVEVAEINDELAVLRAEEQREIEKILRELSGEVSEYSGTLRSSYKALVELDLIFAKAEMGLDMQGVKPVLNGDGIIKLRRARHPLIDQNKVVPIDITLGESYRALVITGSNTGGKTVTLKTAGLLTLMAMCGLFIPAGEGSEICVFENILADIGDEQSLEDSVSTFSAHIERIISIIARANSKSLVLLDEIGSGTDPAEGAALAEAILNELLSKNAAIIATTHYSELKSYAMTASGVSNACVEFDKTTLKPTYRLLIGMPGLSNAFEISRKLGLDPKIVDDAEQISKRRDNRLEAAIAELHELNSKMRSDVDESAEMKAELKRQTEIAERERAALEKERTEILENARLQANRIIENVRVRANIMLNDLEKAKKDESKTAAAKFREAEKSLDRTMHDISGEIAEVEKAEAGDKRPVKVGDTVRLAGTEKTGTVIGISDHGATAKVSFGSVRITVSADELRLADSVKEQPKRQITIKTNRTATQRSSVSEIDLRGFDTAEAIIELDNFIDGAVMNGLGTVWIIHGKGTGALRRAVRVHLNEHPNIKSFRPGVYGEGEDGVTVAELQ